MKWNYFLSTVIYLTFTGSAFAARTPGDPGGGGRTVTNSLCPADTDQFFSLCNLTADKLGSTIGNFISFIFLIAVIAALFYLVWGGLKWLMSAGDKTALQGAREHIVAAIIGLIIIFLSYLILNFILQFFLPGFKLTDFKIPTISGT